MTDLLTCLPDQFTVYITRHATPDRSRYDIPYHTPPGPELTERGRQEASQLGAYLQGCDLGLCLVSPLERALRTGMIAGGDCGVPVEIDQDLAEWRLDENEAAVQARMQRAFIAAAVWSNQNEQALALVSHGSPVLALLRMLGLPVEIVERCRIYDTRNLIPMGGAWRVQRDGNELRLNLVFAPEGVPFPQGMPDTEVVLQVEGEPEGVAESGD